MEAVAASRSIATTIIVSVLLTPASPTGASLPNRSTFVVPSGTLYAGTAVGTAVAGVEIPSRIGCGSEINNEGRICGALVGVADGTGVAVGRSTVATSVAVAGGAAVLELRSSSFSSTSFVLVLVSVTDAVSDISDAVGVVFSGSSRVIFVANGVGIWSPEIMP